MPGEDPVIQVRPVIYSPALPPNQSAARIFQSIKEQEAQFEQLTRELEAERQSVATQLEIYKRQELEKYESGNLLSYGSTKDKETSYCWRPLFSESPVFRKDSEPDSRLTDSHLILLTERNLPKVCRFLPVKL
ncbi:plakophilin-4-like [Limulus polyphemus]|uniref:Plakophilin-4-like n=1 Tax=Limulus polyphemus TaxID=6850 RepID=A0ABM1SCN6_LIMPO|nr:plakophilin-4-like [Limulus polyphemus]